MGNYISVANGAYAISIEKYNALETDGACKKAVEVPDGTQLEVYDKATGKIVKYAEAIEFLWFER